MVVEVEGEGEDEDEICTSSSIPQSSFVLLPSGHGLMKLRMMLTSDRDSFEGLSDTVHEQGDPCHIMLPLCPGK